MVLIISAADAAVLMKLENLNSSRHEGTAAMKPNGLDPFTIPIFGNCKIDHDNFMSFNSHQTRTLEGTLVTAEDKLILLTARVKHPAFALITCMFAG